MCTKTCDSEEYNEFKNPKTVFMAVKQERCILKDCNAKKSFKNILFRCSQS